MGRCERHARLRNVIRRRRDCFGRALNTSSANRRANRTPLGKGEALRRGAGALWIAVRWTFCVM